MSLEGLQLNSYRLLSRISIDGISEIYLATHIHTGKQATIKVFQFDTLDGEDVSKEDIQHILDDARAIAQLDHPNILPLLIPGEEHINGNTVAYIITPIPEEESLRQWLQQQKQPASLLPGQAGYIVHHVAEALKYVHEQGILHLAVKPTNILMRQQDKAPPQFLLTGFHLRVPTTTAQSVRGTPDYMAPELWQSPPTPVAASDQYALGIMAYELLAGRPPFQGKTSDLMRQHVHVPPPPLSTFKPDLAQDINFVVQSALAKLPQQRFGSIQAFDRAFQATVQTTTNTIQAPVPPANEKSVPPPSPEVPATPALLPSPPKPPISRLTILLLILACLTIVGSAFTYYAALYLPKQQEQLHSHATATALANLVGATPTTSTTLTGADITATVAQSMLNQTVQAQITSLEASYQATLKRLTTGAPTFADPMTDPHDTNWDTFTQIQVSCNITASGYRMNGINIKPAQNFGCYARKTFFGNFVYQADIKVAQGDIFGLIFRGDLTNAKGYGFLVGTNGRYELDAYAGRNKATKMLINGPDPIATKHTINRLTVIAQDYTFDMFINGIYAGSVRDTNTSSVAGAIGLFTGVLSSNNTDATWAQVKIWQI